MDEKKLVVMEHVLLGLLEEAGKNGINLVKVRERAVKSLERAKFGKEITDLAENVINKVPK